jgi:hypothetical protein
LKNTEKKNVRCAKIGNGFNIISEEEAESTTIEVSKSPTKQYIEVRKAIKRIFGLISNIR